MSVWFVENSELVNYVNDVNQCTDWQIGVWCSAKAILWFVPESKQLLDKDHHVTGFRWCPHFLVPYEIVDACFQPAKWWHKKPAGGCWADLSRWVAWRRHENGNHMGFPCRNCRGWSLLPLADDFVLLSEVPGTDFASSTKHSNSLNNRLRICLTIAALLIFVHISAVLALGTWRDTRHLLFKSPMSWHTAHPQVFFLWMKSAKSTTAATKDATSGSWHRY